MPLGAVGLLIGLQNSLRANFLTFFIAAAVADFFHQQVDEYCHVNNKVEAYKNKYCQGKKELNVGGVTVAAVGSQLVHQEAAVRSHYRQGVQHHPQLVSRLSVYLEGEQQEVEYKAEDQYNDRPEEGLVQQEGNSSSSRAQQEVEKNKNSSPISVLQSLSKFSELLPESQPKEAVKQQHRSHCPIHNNPHHSVLHV